MLGDVAGRREVGVAHRQQDDVFPGPLSDDGLVPQDGLDLWRDRLGEDVVIAVLDALYATRRDIAFPSGENKKLPVFNMSFSVR